MEELLKPKDMVILIRNELKGRKGTQSALANKKGVKVATFHYQVKSLLERMEDFPGEVHDFANQLGLNVEVRYEIKTDPIDRGDEGDGRDWEDPEAIENPPPLHTALAEKLKSYIRQFLRKESPDDINQFGWAFKGRFGRLRKLGLLRLIANLERIRSKVNLKTDDFYKRVAGLVRGEDGKVFKFHYLFNAYGESKEFKEFLERVNVEFGIENEPIRND